MLANWADVQKEYDMQEPEPEKLIIAYYDIDDYEGNSVVIYKNNLYHFYNEASHCSCNGLENSWDPIKYENRKLLLECLKRSYAMEHFPEVIEAIENVNVDKLHKKLGLE